MLALAVLPRLRVGGRQLLEHEMPGPEIETLSTRIRDTAQRVWILYIALTAVLFLILLGLGVSGVDDEMTPFQAFAHALTTIPTAGFSTKADSMEGFAAATQWVIVLFMILGGINFALMYRAIVRRQPRAATRDEEFRLYFALLVVGAIVVVTEIWTENVLPASDAFRAGVFTAVSTMTTTGFSVANYNTWPTLALMTIVGLMFIGGSAGSTTGSVKVVRHLLVGKLLRREIDQTLHPEIVLPVRLNRRVVEERTLRAVSSFVLLYVGIFVIGASVLAIDAARTGLDLSSLDAVSVSASMLSNVGPAFGIGGPLGSFEPFSDFSTLVMTGLMWLGRLEIDPHRRPALTPLLAQRLARSDRLDASDALRAARLPCRAPAPPAPDRRAGGRSPPRRAPSGRSARRRRAGCLPAALSPATRLPAAGESRSIWSSTISRFSFRSSSRCTIPCSGTSCSTSPSTFEVAQTVCEIPSRSKCSWLRGSLTLAITFGTR